MSLSKIPFPSLLPVEKKLKHLKKADYRFMPWRLFPDRQRWLDHWQDEIHRIVGNTAPCGMNAPTASPAASRPGTGRGRRGGRGDFIHFLSKNRTKENFYKVAAMKMKYQEISKKAATWMINRGWKKLTGKHREFNQSLFEHTMVELDAGLRILDLRRILF